MKYNNIIFDLDGTITEPAVGITNGLIYALGHYGIKVDDITSLYKFIGPPLSETFKTFGFEGEENHAIVAKYREYYSTKGVLENDLMPGIADALKTLKNAGLKLYIATSKYEPFAVRILEHLNVACYFDYIAGSDASAGRDTKADVINYLFAKQNITDNDLASTVMVGDRMYDIEGAKTVGIDSVGVLYGYGNQEEFEKAGADPIVDTAKDLVVYLL